MVFFLTLPFIRSAENAYFSLKEPFFSSPLVQSHGLLLRNDAYGKGYFGASRSGGRRPHEGIDLVAEEGAPVLAAKSGRILFSGDRKGYGKSIDIRHSRGYVTRYAHLSLLNVKEGEWIRKGALIGNTGKSGNASRPNILPHLHFEIQFNKKPVNPSKGYLDPAIQILNK